MRILVGPNGMSGYDERRMRVINGETTSDVTLVTWQAGVRRGQNRETLGLPNSSPDWPRAELDAVNM
jgi:hypothetical protein